MECCVCLESIPPGTEVTFARSIGCHPTHLLCLSCYVRVNGCPLCRFSPYHEVDDTGRWLILTLRNNKQSDEKICYMKTQLNLVLNNKIEIG
jgi:hypothetical protein